MANPLAQMAARFRPLSIGMAAAERVLSIFKIVRPIVSIHWAQSLRKPLSSIKSGFGP